MTKLYIVVTEVSAGNNLIEKGREDITPDGKVVKLTYVLNAEQRKRINAVRNKYRNRIVRNNSLTIRSLVICNEEQKTAIETDMAEADREMKELAAKIHKEIEESYGEPNTPEIRDLIADIKVPDLKAHVEFWPLDSGDIAKGQIYINIVNTIKFKVFDEAFNRIAPAFNIEEGKQLPTRTQTALKKLCLRLRAINILDDEDVNEKIDKIENMLERESYAPLREYLEEEKIELRQVTGRAAAVEM
jgi:hypothetical protein